MKSRFITGAVALALLGSVLAPASAAQAAGATVSGVVEYKDKAIANILVGWYVPSTGKSSTVTSKADGSYSLALPASGTEYVLFGNLKMDKPTQLRGKTGYTGVFYGDGDVRNYAYQAVDAYTSGASDVVDIELGKPGAIWVQDPRLADYYFSAMNGGGEAVTEPVRANRGGWFEFPNLIPGTYYLSNFYPDEFVNISSEPIEVTEGSNVEFDPQVSEGGIIEGVVSNAAGKSVKDVAVIAVNKNDKEEHFVYTDAKGNYRLRGLTESSYTVTFAGVESRSSLGFLEKTITVSNLVADTAVTKNVALSTGGRVAGTVKLTETKNGTNAYQHVVSIADWSGNVLAQASVNAKGAYSFSGLPTGRYRVLVSVNGSSSYAHFSVAAKAGSLTKVAEAKRTKKTVTVSGKVTNLPQPPAKNSPVVYWNTEGATSGYVTTSSNGSYTLKYVVPGTVTFNVASTNHAIGTTEKTISKTTTLALKPGKSLGKVAGAVRVDGTPLSRGTALFDAATDETGAFVKNGAFNQLIASGPHTFGYVATPGMFPGNSPFWYSVPDAKRDFTVSPGKRTTVGTLDLVLGGVESAALPG